MPLNIRKKIKFCFIHSLLFTQVFALFIFSFFLTKCENVRGRLKCDGTRAETRFRHSAKGTSPFKSAGASVQLTTGSRHVRISGSNAGYTMFQGGVKGTGYPLHSPVSPSLSHPCVTVCHRISTGVYLPTFVLFRFLFPSFFSSFVLQLFVYVTMSVESKCILVC
jgi:hypothetical protein